MMDFDWAIMRLQEIMDSVQTTDCKGRALEVSIAVSSLMAATNALILLKKVCKE